ncbi:MAG: S8 family serine peptidase, partial [Acidimicrobiia bacterium]
MKSRRSVHPLVVVGTVTLAITLSTFAGGSRVSAQQTEGIGQEALSQIAALAEEKAARTPAERKLDSQVLYVSRMAQGEAVAAGVQTLDIELPDVNARGAVLDVSVEVGKTVLDEFVALGAEIIDINERYDHVRLRIELSQVEALAAIPQVSFVGPKREAITNRVDAEATAIRSLGVESVDALRERKLVERAETPASIRQGLQVEGALPNVGSQNSEGDPKHLANTSRSAFGVNGTGVRIGVLSDGVDGLATSQGLGDLGPVTVLPGQEGTGAEGTAMLEIIHDLAPGAELYFATAFNGMESFADNIRALRAAGSDIIVDDVGYLVETPFQDGQTTPSPLNGGIVIQAVKDVVADGALFFSAAANSGNVNDGTSGTWEGDFVDGGPATGVLTGAGQVHDFGGQLFNVLTATTPNPVTLHWADPLGGSANDYDLYILDSTGTTVEDAGTNVQDGTQDPFEFTGPALAGERMVIVRFSGLDRFLHLTTNRGLLSIATEGETHGHAATTAANSFGVAATSAQVNGSNPFNGSHVVETYSSDGPRRIFFQGNGAAITPGNFTETGGQVLQKPDLTAADDVSVTGVGGFPSPFQGTSAAAPHAAAIAALVQSRFPAVSASGIRNALFASAIDIEAGGTDRDSGRGIIMANQALASLASPPSMASQPASQTIPSGSTAMLSATASGTPVLRYQWYSGTSGNTTTPIAGAISSTFTTPALTATTRYWVRVTNPVGTANSTTATITVTPSPPPPPPPTGQRFADVPPGHVFFSAIGWLAAEGITFGCNPPINDRFCPADSVSRGEMAVFLVRAFDYTDNGGGNLFVDDDGLFYENSADRLFTAGVTQGCNPPTNNRYCGDDNVTRGQMAAFLARAFSLPAYNGPDRFVDDNGSIFEGALEKLAQAGITVGC